MKAEKGKKVTVEYTGTLDDGTVFDSSEKHGEPLSFEVGSGQMIPGFDAAVVGMEVGSEKEITLDPKDAYGDRRDELIRDFPRDQLPKDQELKEGMMLAIGLPNGQQLPAVVTKLSDDKVTIDVNHPLAGKKLHFKIKLVSVE